MGYRGNYVIVGPPGTGKTERVARSVERVVDEGLMPAVCSLTRAAAQEVAGRVDLPRGNVGTLHSMGYRAQGSPRILKSRDLDEWKYCELMSPVAADPGQRDDLNHGNSTAHDKSGRWELLELYRHRLTPRSHWRGDIVELAGTWQKWKRDRDLIDFTDMIELMPSDLKLCGDADVIICDEAQDLSALELLKLRECAQHGRALILTGDPYQALYTWRGARPRSLSHPDATVPDDHKDVLRQSFRLPRRVHAVAITWLKRITGYKPFEYRPKDDAGDVSYSSATSSHPRPVLREAVDKVNAGRRVMIMATCGYHLYCTCRDLRQMGVAFANPMRTKNGAWNPLGHTGTTMARRILSLTAAKREGRLWTGQELRDWASPMVSEGLIRRGMKKGLGDLPKERIISFDALSKIFEADCLGALWSKTWEGTGVDLLDWWQSCLMSSRVELSRYPLKIYVNHGHAALSRPPNLWVGTCHSFKGGEADDVYLFPDLAPVAYRAYIAKCGDAYDSVVRTIYVGMTRARESLTLCAAERAYRVGWPMTSPATACVGDFSASMGSNDDNQRRRD